MVEDDELAKGMARARARASARCTRAEQVRKVRDPCACACLFAITCLFVITMSVCSYMSVCALTCMFVRTYLLTCM